MNAIDRPNERPGFARAEHWADFLKPLMAAMNQQPGREQFLARCAAIAYALPDIPASMLVPWRQRDAMRRFKFLPSPSEIGEWLAEDIRAERESADRRARYAALPAPEPEERTPEAIAAVLTKARAFAAEMTGKASDPDRTPPRPLPLSDGALLAQYEALAAEGKPGAAIRAQMLRQRIGADA